MSNVTVTGTSPNGQVSKLFVEDIKTDKFITTLAFYSLAVIPLIYIDEVGLHNLVVICRKNIQYAHHFRHVLMSTYFFRVEKSFGPTVEVLPTRPTWRFRVYLSN